MNKIHQVRDAIVKHYPDAAVTEAFEELTWELSPDQWLSAARLLRDDPELNFVQLMDVCGVDYLHYGLSDWTTHEATASGFERAVDKNALKSHTVPSQGPRFAVVYHLLSLEHNTRLRVKVRLSESHLIVPSVVEVWSSADWFEREAFDLFGILFEGHPDLRRLLTDYGFIGHPFRKDFPLIGEVEMRYDAASGRVIYEPVSIESRTLVPRVIRQKKV